MTIRRFIVFFSVIFVLQVFIHQESFAKEGSVFLAYQTSLKATGVGLSFRPEKAKYGLEGTYYFTGGEYEDEGPRDGSIKQEFENAFTIAGQYFFSEELNSGYVGIGYLYFKMGGDGSAYGGDLRVEEADLNVSSFDIFVGYSSGKDFVFDLRLGYLTDPTLKGEITVAADVSGTTYRETYDVEEYDIEMIDQLYFFISIGYRF